jgi:exosortase A-associated hydrolase 1
LTPPEVVDGRGAEVLWFELASPAAVQATAESASTEAAAQPGPPQPLPASRPAIARWQQAGHAVHASVLTGPAFWATTEIETAEALIEASTAALAQRLGPATEATPAPAPTPASDAAEQALVFDCQGESLVGVLHRPAVGVAAQRVGVLIIVGGPQYRVGSHRQFVHLARALAGAGYPVLRFDVRGMGDSSGSPTSFEQQDEDIDAALCALHAAVPDLQRTVLWGLCDGASAALMYLQRRVDARIGGLALANPWVRSAATQARTLVRHYYWDRLRQPSFWRKLLTGGVAGKALADLRGNLRAAGQGSVQAGSNTAMAFQARMALGWMQAQQPILLLNSGQDYTAREFLDACGAQPEWRGALDKPGLCRHDLPDADHTFSGPGDKDAAAQATLAWLQRCVTPSAAEKP